ncbi:unnamed protein product [marine sediment metagenome]|uniref:Uncharacterized protein n=1 Tax=marine sediment metagenome TaxID=412755 RepID=X0ZKV5_9ZZZZ
MVDIKYTSINDMKNLLFLKKQDKITPGIESLKKRISSAIEAGVEQAKKVEQTIREKVAEEKEEVEEAVEEVKSDTE